jgi:hypothetical protein
MQVHQVCVSMGSNAESEPYNGGDGERGLAAQIMEIATEIADKRECKLPLPCLSIIFFFSHLFIFHRSYRCGICHQV